MVRDNLELHVQDRLSIEATLKVGSVNQEVVVTGREPLLQTQTADVGNVTGVVNVTAGDAHFNAAAPTLQMGEFNVTEQVIACFPFGQQSFAVGDLNG